MATKDDEKDGLPPKASEERLNETREKLHEEFKNRTDRSAMVSRGETLRGNPVQGFDNTCAAARKRFVDGDAAIAMVIVIDYPHSDDGLEGSNVTAEIIAEKLDPRTLLAFAQHNVPLVIGDRVSELLGRSIKEQITDVMREMTLRSVPEGEKGH